MLYINKLICACLSLEVTDVLRAVGMKETSVTCASVAVHIQLVSRAQRYFTCTLTMLMLQALYQDQIIYSLQTNSILHGIPNYFSAGL